MTVSALRLTALLVGALVLCSCGSVPQTHYYLLEPADFRPGSPSGSASGLAVGVKVFQVDPPYDQDRIVYRANMLGLLRRRDLTRVADQLSGELGLQYAESEPGKRIEGVYRRRLDLVSGRFAVIEKSREFTLVPWRPVLERNLGKQVSGTLRGDTISWSLGRKRRGPGIS